MVWWFARMRLPLCNSFFPAVRLTDGLELSLCQSMMVARTPERILPQRYFGNTCAAVALVLFPAYAARGALLENAQHHHACGRPAPGAELNHPRGDVNPGDGSQRKIAVAITQNGRYPGEHPFHGPQRPWTARQQAPSCALGKSGRSIPTAVGGMARPPCPAPFGIHHAL